MQKFRIKFPKLSGDVRFLKIFEAQPQKNLISHNFSSKNEFSLVQFLGSMLPQYMALSILSFVCFVCLLCVCPKNLSCFSLNIKSDTDSFSNPIIINFDIT